MNKTNSMKVKLFFGIIVMVMLVGGMVSAADTPAAAASNPAKGSKDNPQSVSGNDVGKKSDNFFYKGTQLTKESTQYEGQDVYSYKQGDKTVYVYIKQDSAGGSGSGDKSQLIGTIQGTSGGTTSSGNGGIVNSQQGNIPSINPTNQVNYFVRETANGKKEVRSIPGDIPIDGHPMTQEQYDFYLANKDSSQVSLNNGVVASIFTVSSRGRGDAMKTTTTSIVQDNGESKRTVSTKLGDKTITKTYNLVDGKYKFDSSTANGVTLPFSSSKWSLKTVNGQVKLAYSGKTGEVQTGTGGNSKWFKFDGDDGGFVREVDGTIIEKKSNGEITITPEGGKGIPLSSKEAEAIFGSSLSGDMNPFDKNLVKNIDTVMKAAENNRIDRDKLKKGEDSLDFEGGSITIDDKNNIVVKKGKEDSADFKQITYDSEGRVTQTQVGSGDKASTAKWVYNDDGTLKSFSTNDNSRYELVHGGEGQQNVVMWTQDGANADGTIGINLEDGSAYVLKGGKWESCSTDDCSNLEKEMDNQIEARRVAAGGRTNAEARTVKIFNTLESAQTGFGKLFSLFMSDESKAKWQKQVDDFFCSTILLGGKECWTSMMCGDFQDKIGEETLIIDTPGGMLDAAAHVEGERQSLLFRDEGEEKGEYLYKLSYGVRNPDNREDDIEFNVRLTGDRTVYLHEEYEKVAPGDTYSRSGKDVFVKYGNASYDRICMVFKQGIERASGDYVDEICNTIVPSIGVSYDYNAELPEESDDDVWI